VCCRTLKTTQQATTNLHDRRVGEDKAISTAGFERQVAQEAIPVAGRDNVAVDDTDSLGGLGSLTVDRLGATQVRVGLPRRQRPTARRRRRTDRHGSVTVTVRQQRRMGASSATIALTDVPVHLLTQQSINQSIDQCLKL